MILSRTPFRVTLGGGGTDLPAFYRRHGGHVLAMGLDKYMFVAVNAPVVGRKVRVNYTRNEVVDHPRELRHELARAALLRHGIESRLEVTSMGDLPSGTGLGSSSAYLVGLLQALRNYRRDHCSLQELAEEACALEIDQVRGSAGKHDAYMAAFGGMTVLDIRPDGGVSMRRIELGPGALTDFIANTQLYWTGLSQTPGNEMDYFRVLDRSSAPGHEQVMAGLAKIKETSYEIVEAIEKGDFDEFGRLMDVHWTHKKTMSNKIAIPGVDELYNELKERFGVLGGKVAGTGGGGFFMIYAPGRHREIGTFMAERGLQRLPYNLDFEGVKVIHNTPDTAVQSQFARPSESAAPARGAGGAGMAEGAEGT